MKGYDTDIGYMGFVDGRYMLFAKRKLPLAMFFVRITPAKSYSPAKSAL